MQDEKIYCRCMEEVKARMNLVLGFLSSHRSTGSEITNTEFVCLQVRKILELIALGSIAPNKAKHAEHREKFHKDWNARTILRDLERINPDFYPVPVKQIQSTIAGVDHHFENVSSGFLTKSDFLKVYKKCGGVLHAENPFGQKRDLGAVRRQFPKWVNQITTLLRTHRIRLIDSSKIWVVVMEHPHDKKVHTLVGVGR